VLVTDATSSMRRIISDSSGRSKGSRHPVDVARRCEAVLGKFAKSVGQVWRAYLRLMGDRKGSRHLICGHSSSRKGNTAGTHRARQASPRISLVAVNHSEPND
jgi:hypothetical protein